MFNYKSLMTTQTRYSQFNALTVTGRIYNAEIVENNGQRFLSVSVISTATKNGTDVVSSSPTAMD